MATASPPPSAPPASDEWSTETWIAIALGGAMILTVGLGVIYMAWRRFHGRTLATRPITGRVRVSAPRASAPKQGPLEAVLFAPAPGEERVDGRVGDGAPSIPLLALPHT